MKKIALLALVLCSLTACERCKDEPAPLDFSTGETFEATLLAERCWQDNCRETPYWEGQNIITRGIIDRVSVAPDSTRCFLLDSGGHPAIEVRFLAKRSLILQKINTNTGQCTFSARGASQDLPINGSCARVLALEISDTVQVRF